jgi:hypothetical protein
MSLVLVLDSFMGCLINDVNVPERGKKIVVPGRLTSAL